MKSFFRTKQLLSLFICLVIVSSLAIVKHGELLGHSFRSEQKPQAANNDTLRILGNGTAVINLLHWHQTSWDMVERCHSTSSSRMVS